ncbi:phosphoribosylaminoimidazolesuccinocarboxamide synthase [Hydrogeniiclostridium mannosilyticum]|uniref:phosphoribosylaminoimidazolesuccinocarboxamide synthase n=1 Tax=Hydrogeniiclostridium mannosilyticum TaxID=2764322 RepID=UPI00399BE998
MKPIYTGNVHEVYSVSENQLIIVSTDQMYVHGKIIPMNIKDKGVILMEISNFWFL